ncbi:MAG: hypothetical protein PHU46_08475 [Rhodocyclaceae bacterium]|nr:hypothetical protein [Rhodocyclaceae bacterium]
MKKLTRRVGSMLVLCALVSLPLAGQGAEGETPDLALRGFGTLGVARSDNGNAEFVRDLSQPNGIGRNWSARGDSLFGLQANYRVADNLEAVAQGVSHYRYDGSFSPELTWAYLKFEPSPDMMLRAGRFGTEFFMLADSRSVGYSYLTVRPPVDFFGNLPMNYVDGVFGRFTRRLESGLVRAELYTGLAREKLPTKGEFLDLAGSRLNGVSLDFQQGPWQARLSYAQLRFQNGTPMPGLTGPLIATGLPSAIGAAQALNLAGTYVHYRAFGVAYDDGAWQAQCDLNSTLRDSVLWEDLTSGYLIVGRRVGKWTPFLGYSWTRSGPKTLDTGVPALNPAVAGVLAFSHQDQHTVILGGRWDWRHNMDLKAQLDIVRGSASSVALVQNATPAWDGHIRVFTLALDFVF